MESSGGRRWSGSITWSPESRWPTGRTRNVWHAAPPSSTPSMSTSRGSAHDTRAEDHLALWYQRGHQLDVVGSRHRGSRRDGSDVRRGAPELSVRHPAVAGIRVHVRVDVLGGEP